MIILLLLLIRLRIRELLINSACDVVSPTILETRFAASDDRKMNIKKLINALL